MSNIKVIQIVGWPRSGTNYLQWLLRKNFRDLIVIPGYKHSSNSAPYMACLEGGQPKEELRGRMERLGRTCDLNDQEVQTSDLMENYLYKSQEVGNKREASTYALQAIHDNALLREIRYAMVIKHPIHAFLSYIKAWPAKRNSENLMPGWNTFHCEWIDFFLGTTTGRCTVQRFRNLVMNPQGMLTDVASDLRIQEHRLHRSTVSLPQSRLDGACRETGQPFDAQYVRQQKYLDQIILAEQEKIKAAVSSDLMRFVGYHWEKTDADL